MKKLLLKTWLMLVCLLVGVGSAWATVHTYDFSGVKENATSTLWFSNSELTNAATYISSATGIGTTATTLYYKTGEAFTCAATNSNKCYFSTTNATASSYFMFGKSGAYITLPTFTGEKITNVTIQASSGHSTSVSVNIVNTSDVAASTTQTWSSQGKSHSYDILEARQSDQLRIKVTNAYNAQIRSVTITTEPVVAKTLSSIELSGTYKTEFLKGETFDHAGMVVTAHYSDADDEIVTSSATWSEPNMESTGTKTVTVSYTRSSVTKTAQYNINVTTPIYSLPFYESFNTNEGTGGNDSQWSGTIASSDIKSDNVGWTFVQSKGAKACAKFGTGSAAGSATTPELNYTGNAVLTFKAAAWNGKDETTTISLSATNGVTLSKTSIELTKAAWNEYEVILTGITPGTQITFAGSAGNNRFFLDEVRIVPGYTKSLSATGYASFSAPYNVTVPAGTTAYKAAIDGDAVVLTSVDGVIPANTGVILYNESKPASVVLTATSEAGADYDGNELLATSVEANKTIPAEGTFYALSATEAKFVSLKNGITLSADKAYLPDPANHAGSLRVVIEGMEDGHQTSIETIETVNSNVMYDLQGRRANGKGLMIQNGKVVLVK